MAVLADIITRVRNELGDLSRPFHDVYTGTGNDSSYDLTEERVQVSDVTATYPDGTTITLSDGVDYVVDTVNGLILFQSGSFTPVPPSVVILVNGTTYGMFTDDEITLFVNDAVIQHCHHRETTWRYRDGNGFFRYARRPMDLDTLPPIEELLVSYLGTLNALWELSTDAATDVDVDTADGTHLARSQRYAQILNQIDVLTTRYTTLCEQLNVGLARIEMGNLRRVSRTTGRLVPIFREREFDDYTLPTRMIPEIDAQDEDESGLPTGAYFGYW